ncbi:MAG: DMT family transporter [Acetobacteraceae bacterium]|nr:DMT family transporter [Acetobacteraceae bacterium]
MRGLLLAALGYAVVSGADAAVKWVLPEIGPAAAMLWRGVVSALVIVVVVRGRGLRVHRWGLLTARSLLNCAVTAAWFFAWLLGVGLADSYAVAAACPLLMTLLAIPLLGERVGWRRWCSTGVGFLGVLVMLQPGGDLWRWESGLLLVATCGMAVARIMTRTLSATETPQAIAFWHMAAHLPVGLLLMAVPALAPPGGAGFAGVIPGWQGTLVILTFGVTTALAHLLLVRAFGLAPVSALAPFEYTPLLWGVVLGYLLWAEVPAWTTIGGSAVVIAAGLYNLHRERVRRAEERRAAERG